MRSNYQSNINTALKELHTTKNISSALLVCNTLLEYMGIETKSVEDIELSKLKLPNAERYDRWFDAHPHFRGDRACFELTSKEDPFEAKFFALQKRSKLFIAGAVNFTPNFEDRDYTRNDPNTKVGIDFFFTHEKDSVIVVLSNKGSLRLVELSGRLTNTQNEIFALWNNIAQTEDRNIFHTTLWESFKLSSLNKKFYEGTVNSFTSLTQHMQLAGVEEQLANQFANRLLGRLLFIWFLRKKKIVNESKEYFILGDQDDTTYYSEKLSYLFFNVLNTAVSERDRVQESKETLFGTEKKDPTLFIIDSETPYLNGGLFDQNSDGEYWNINKPTFPTGFFKALYDHFDSFNFTTDESTPEYEQIAIDPEMLGRIFESFLATLKTETGAQAKKANGAFYTPREIVSYMSRESLRQYLYTALDASVTLKSSINDLLDRSDSEWALAGTNSKRDAVAKEDRKRIMDALREIKVLDPAVGSGAFPMGILHKILSIFERLEPNFDSYETKLSILRNNIYGVDIDPTAIEISRLRAWLSIVVDEKDIKKIKPLPNLDFKFVCANSLIGLEKSENSFTSDEGLKPELIRIRDEYYATSSKVKKEKLQKDYIKLTHRDSLFDTEETRQLKSYKPFENGKSASFYDPELMHGVAVFDVVIGNPPYGHTIDENKAYFTRHYISTEGKHEIFKYFIEKGLSLLSKNGILSFITSDTWTSLGYFKKLRKLIYTDYCIKAISKSLYNVFETATVDTNIYFIAKSKPSAEYFLIDGDLKTKEKRVFEMSDEFVFNLKDENLIVKKIENATQALSVFCEIWQGLIAYGKKDQPREFTSEKKETELHRKLLYGGDISRFNVNWSGEYLKYGEWLHRPRPSYIFDNEKILVQRIRNPKLKNRLVCAIDSSGYINGTGLSNILLKDKVKTPSLKYLLSLLNSKLINYWFSYYFIDVNIKPEQLRKIPIKIPNSEREFISIVDKISSIKSEIPKANTEDLENQIDHLVYRLYGLNEEEIKIVENN